jgi:hypothetical protein
MFSPTYQQKSADGAATRGRVRNVQCVGDDASTAITCGAPPYDYGYNEARHRGHGERASKT